VSRAAHRLPRGQRQALIAIGAGSLVTGAAWLALHYLAGAGRGELPHPLEAWLMRLHGLTAFLALFMLGMLAAAHVPQGWRLSGRHRWAAQRATGVALCSLGAALSLSGYLLYYFASESARPALGWLHALIGVAMAVLAGVHGRRKGRLA
jgi:hypothetical protein